MNFDFQRFAATALYGTGDTMVKNYEAQADEQRQIREENRRYETSMRKERELGNIQQQRKAQQMQELRTRGESMGLSGRELERFVFSGGSNIAQSAEEREGAFQTELDQKTRIAQAEQDISLRGKQKEIQMEPGMRAEAAKATVTEFYPELEPGSKAFNTKVRQVAKLETKAKGMSDEQQRLWFKDAYDHATERVDKMIEDGQENEIEMLGGQQAAIKKFSQEYLSNADMDKPGGDRVTNQDIITMFEKPPEDQQKFVAAVEENEGPEAAAKVQEKFEELRQSKVEATPRDFTEQEAFESGAALQGPESTWQQKSATEQAKEIGSNIGRFFKWLDEKLPAEEALRNQ